MNHVVEAETAAEPAGVDAPEPATRIEVLAETADTVTISRADWERLLDALEDVGDLAAATANRAREADAGPGLVRTGYLTWDEWERVRAGASPLLVLRERRRLTQVQLAEAAGVGQDYLSEIEQGRKTGSADALHRLARVLGTSIDVLAVPRDQAGRPP